MATFAPQIGSNIGFEQPVVPPRSDLNAISTVVGVAGQLFKQEKAKEPKEPSTSDILAGDKAQFYNDLAIGRAQIEQGNAQSGNRVITNAYRSFARKYGREHEDINKAFSDATGISFDVEVTGSPVDSSAITDTQEFAVTAALLQSQNPDASPDEIYQLAIETEVNRMGLDARIKQHEQNEKATWIDVERDYVSKAQQHGDLLKSLISTANKDQIITPDEARGIRDYINKNISGLQKPAGVDTASWASFQSDYVEPLIAIGESAVGLSLEHGLNSDTNRAYLQIINKAISQGKLPPSLTSRLTSPEAGNYENVMRLLQAINVDTKYTDNYNFVMNGTLEELVNWVTEFEMKTDLDELSVDPSEFNKADPSDKRQSILTDAKVITLSSDPGQLSKDILNQVEKVISLDSSALQSADLEKIYNPVFFQAIQKVYEANPIIGRQLAEKALTSIEGQEVTFARAIASEAAQLGFRIENGKLLVDDSQLPSTVKTVVDHYFGGDWNLAVELEGKDKNGITHSAIKSVLDKADKRVRPNLEKFTKVSRTIGTLRQTLYDSGVLVSPEEEVPETSSEVRRETSPGTLDLIREFEGFREGAYWDVNAYRSGYGSDTITRRDGSVVTVTKDTKVTREDAERDLARRVKDFQNTAAGQVGREVWTSLPGNVVDALTSVTYNYGSLPASVVSAVKAGDIEGIAQAVEGLAGHNNGINRNRRLREAAIIRGDATPSSAAPVYTAPPVARDTSYREEVAPQTSPQPRTEPSSSSVGVAMPQGAQATQEGSQRATEASGESKKGMSKERASQLWAELSSSTKGLLWRIFGGEDEILRALESGEITEEELR